jgi:hypothetical protein
MLERVKHSAALRWLLLAVAVFVLNAALSFHNYWPTPLVELRGELSMEAAVLLLGLAVYVELGGRWSRRLTTVLTVVLVALVLGRYAEETSHGLYGRPVNLYWDAQHLPNVAAMLIDVVPLWAIVAGVLGIVLLLAAIAALLYGSLAHVAVSFTRPLMRRVVGAGAALVVGVYVVSNVVKSPIRWYYSVPVTQMYGEQMVFVLAAAFGAPQLQLHTAKLAETDLARVAGADVLLLFIESYGAVAFDEPEVIEVVGTQRDDLALAVQETGRRVVSAFVTSPTFGGGSWLAHASFMSGYEVRDQGDYNLLLTQQLQTIPKRFKASGYRAVAWMPGLREAWPEGVFYGFDAIVGERDIGYEGPDFGWWRIPDQYSLAKVAAVELAPGERAQRFIFLPTINTHIPFKPTPPYQPDWHLLLSDAPFGAAVPMPSPSRAEWTDLREAYSQSLAYTYRYLAGFLRERPDDDFVLILLGDHQPAASVTGEHARWEVPVHVIAKRGEILDTLLDHGFVPGIAPSRTAPPIASMPELSNLLLRSFDGGGVPPGAISSIAPAFQ